MREKGERGFFFLGNKKSVNSFIKAGNPKFQVFQVFGKCSFKEKKSANLMMKSETESLRLFNLWGH